MGLQHMSRGVALLEYPLCQPRVVVLSSSPAPCVSGYPMSGQTHVTLEMTSPYRIVITCHGCHPHIVPLQTPGRYAAGTWQVKGRKAGNIWCCLSDLIMSRQVVGADLVNTTDSRRGYNRHMYSSQRYNRHGYNKHRYRGQRYNRRGYNRHRYT